MLREIYTFCMPTSLVLQRRWVWGQLAVWKTGLVRGWRLDRDTSVRECLCFLELGMCLVSVARAACMCMCPYVDRLSVRCSVCMCVYMWLGCVYLLNWQCHNVCVCVFVGFLFGFSGVLLSDVLFCHFGLCSWLHLSLSWLRFPFLFILNVFGLFQVIPVVNFLFHCVCDMSVIQVSAGKHMCVCVCLRARVCVTGPWCVCVCVGVSGV